MKTKLKAGIAQQLNSTFIAVCRHQGALVMFPLFEQSCVKCAPLSLCGALSFGLLCTMAGHREVLEETIHISCNKKIFGCKSQHSTKNETTSKPLVQSNRSFLCMLMNMDGQT